MSDEQLEVPSTARVYRFRNARLTDVPQLVRVTQDSPLHRHVIGLRHLSLEQFFADVVTDAKASSVCLDQHERILGWASCSKYNRRSGYAQTVELAVHTLDDHVDGGVGRELFSRCESSCVRAGVRTIVALAHDSMISTACLYQAFGLSLRGYVELRGEGRLNVYCKTVAREIDR